MTDRYAVLTEGWSDTTCVVYHVWDSWIPDDPWTREPGDNSVLYSSENEEEVRHMVTMLNLFI